jgi:hypothetical protein
LNPRGKRCARLSARWAIEKKVMVGRAMRSAYWLNHDPSGMVEAGYGPATK